MAVAPDQPFVAVTEAMDPLDAVVVMEAQHDGADHVIDPRTESTAGDDAAGDLRWVKK
jgi:hypothetical protein